MLPAQAVVRDAGIRLNGGLVLPEGTSGDIGVAWETGVFYSHWFCGKHTGYQLEAGFGQTTLAQFFVGDIQQTRLFAAALGKLRFNRFNRDREFAMLLGPRADFVASQSPSTPSPNEWQVGVHGGLWLRLPRGRKNSWFIQSGLTYYPTAQYDAPNSASRTWLLTLGLGTTWFHD